MSELKSRSIGGTYQGRAGLQDRQPRRLRIALLILLVGFIGILVFGRSFWFSAPSDLDSDLSEPVATPRAVVKPVPSSANQAKSTPAPATKKQNHIAPKSSAPKTADSPVTATNRMVLPPLDVEVVAGETHSKIHPRNNAAKVQITHPALAAPAPSTATLAAPTSAAEREPMSVNATRPQASYPMLTQRMNVQGSVVLQAVIGTDGVIQNLQVMSGPNILATAAQQAVREWRFKPVYENGQLVETKATITVNFTIKVADNATKEQPGL